MIISTPSNPRDNIVITIDILETSDYMIFHLDPEFNREINRTNKNAIKASFELNGWNIYEAVRCWRRPDGKLVITNGQHRFTVAKELNMPVLYFITPEITKALVAKPGELTFVDHSASDALVAIAAGGKPWGGADTLRHNAIHLKDTRAMYIHDLMAKTKYKQTLIFRLLQAAGITSRKLTGLSLKLLRFELELNSKTEGDLRTLINGLESFGKAFPSMSKKVGERDYSAILTIMDLVPRFEIETLIEAAENFPDKFESIKAKEHDHVKMLAAGYNMVAKGKARILIDKDYIGTNISKILAPNN